MSAESIENNNKCNYKLYNPAPAFIILGVQKSGTTALYDYLTQHPSILKAKSKELHFFDWRFDDALHYRLNQKDQALLEKFRTLWPLTDEQKTLATQLHHEKILNVYPLFFQLENLINYQKISGEATPSYLLMGKVVAQRIKLYAPHAHLIVIVRNPTKRLHSQYNMTVDPVGTPGQKRRRGYSYVHGLSLEQVVDKELTLLKQQKCSPHMSATQFQTQVLDKIEWGYGRKSHGGHSFITRGLYTLQMRVFLEYFEPKQFYVMSMEKFGRTKSSIQTAMNHLYKKLGLPTALINDPSPKNARTYAPMSDQVKEKLDQFYQPYNESWTAMCEKYQWQDTTTAY